MSFLGGKGMLSLRSHFLLRLLSVSILLLLPLFQALAQEEDPDPNSPTPVILSQSDSTRALTSLSAKSRRTRPSDQAFGLDSTVTIYVTNLALMKEEGSTAFRLYATDVKGRQYRFPILEFSETPGFDGIYTVVFRLKDEIGYWEQPSADGDLLLGITWRGLASNRVRLGLGKTGGEIKDDPGAVPTPLSALASLNKQSTETTPTNDVVGYRWSGDRARFLEQAAFGPTPIEDFRVRRIGLRTWLTDQFTQPYPSATNPYPNLPLKSTDSTSVTAGCGMFTNPSPEYSACIRDHYSMYPVQNWFYKEAFYGTPQLRHRVSWALAQIWVISGVDTQQSSWMTTYHQQISKNAFGNWRTLMYDMTLNPGMGNYLDMIRSTRTSPNENYPREVLQLFNVGLFMLNQDGTVQCVEHNPCQAGDTPIPTYDQTTVNNFTKVFTGWRDCRAAGPTAACPNITLGAPDYKDPMELIGANHDLTAKTLFSYPGSTTTNIAACAGCIGTAITTYANNSLNQSLDNIYNHPNVAPFVSKLLIQHLVTSDPTPAYVGRVSAVFSANRTSPTQLQAVVKAILLDPEARGDVKTDPRYGKLREPVQLLTNVLRNFEVGGASAVGQPPLGQSDGVVDGSVSGLGQSVFISPTVFNYYQPNYIVPGTTILGPEFGIYTTGTSIGRANLFATYAFNGLGVALPNRPNGTKISLAEAQAVSAGDATGNQLLDYLNTKMMHGTMSAQMKSAILPAVTAVVSTNTLLRAQTAVYLVATSSQYQVQK
jgi:uncharacterized protein (DUF1800 family)